MHVVATHVLAETFAAAGGPDRWPLVLLALGGLGLYIAARVGTHALAGPGGLAGASAGAIAMGHWAPTAAVALTAVILGRADVALGVAFAASVAAVSLAVGMNVFLVPGEPLPASRRVWPFLLPAALLVVVAGFSGALNLIHATMLAVLGLAVGGVWRSPPADDSAATAGELVAAVEANALVEATDPAAARRRRVWQVVLWVLSAGLAVVAARAAVLGTIAADATNPLLRASIVAAGAVSPLLVLPLLAVGADLAQRNRTGEACSACVGLALLNLLALVPAVIVCWIARVIYVNGWPAPAYAATMRKAEFFQPLVDGYMRIPSVPLPLTVWRIDSVVLAVLGFALLPAALGKWRLGRVEAVALLVAYAAYLAASAFLSLPRR